MARIYKESRYVLQLLIGKSYVAQYDDVKISFYTKNPSNQVMVDNGITIKRNIAEVMVESTLFDNLEEGLISYIVYGTKDGIPFIEERQSNYFLKTPLDFKPTTCILEDKSVTPSMGDRNVDGYIIVEEGEGYDGLSRVVIDPQTLYNEGYGQGKTDGANEQKTKLETINITENGTYTKEDGYNHIEVNVPDLNGSYEQGKTDGINEQKLKLESINITQNGTYTKEDGYNHIEVNVPDLNGSYNEGYAQGQTDVASNARVLNVTENGVYRSKFSGPIPPTLVTGVYADGTEFHNFAELNGKVFNTKIAGSIDRRLEFWYKGDNTSASDGLNVIIGAGNADNINSFRVRYNTNYNDTLRIGVGNSTVYVYDWNDTVWHHLIISKAEGVLIDGEKKGNFSQSTTTISGEFYINGIRYDADGTNIANGTFGMIKIDDTVIIPTADGFLNTNTGELLEVVKDGSYTFTENPPTSPEGELYKTINVNVIPKINVKETGLNFAYSKFTEVPEWADFEGVTDMHNMFFGCENLQTIPQINTSNVTNMDGMFDSCSNLQTIPLIDTSNVTTMAGMFNVCSNLQTIPPLNTSKVGIMDSMFGGCRNLTSIPALNAQSLDMPPYNIFGFSELPKLTDFGGFLNLKYSLAEDYNLKKLPNLTYESCINVLNGLYDFTGNGETPNSEQGQLKVHANFLTAVGEEISIGTNKGWTITA